MPARTLYIGIDAGDRELVGAYIDRGDLPAIESITSRARTYDIESADGTYVGSIWPSFLTSRTVATIGRNAWSQLRPGTYQIHRTHEHTLPAPPWWTQLVSAGERVGIIDVPFFGFDPSLPATQVRDFETHDFSARGGAFATADIGPLERSLTTYCDSYTTSGRRDALLPDLEQSVDRKRDLVADLLGGDQWDLFATVFGASHCVTHQFFHTIDPTHPRHDPAEVARLGDPFKRIFTRIDRAIGRALELAGSDATVVLHVSHGASPHYDGCYLLPEVLERFALQYRPPSALRALVERGVRGVGYHTRSRLQKRGLGNETFVTLTNASLPWFFVPNNEYTGALRFNIKGRDPRGVLRPDEVDDAREWLSARLRELRRVDADRPLVREVWRRTDRYTGGNSDALPDLFIEWDRTEPVLGVRHPSFGSIERTDPGPRSGDHTPDGRLFVAGPDIGPGAMPDLLATEDVGPIIAATCGHELKGVDGRVPADALAT